MTQSFLSGVATAALAAATLTVWGCNDQAVRPSTDSAETDLSTAISPTEMACQRLEPNRRHMGRPLSEMEETELWGLARYLEFCVEDPPRAADAVLEELIKRGDKDAAFERGLGEQYRVGGDKIRARSWMKIAADAGHVEAAKELERMDRGK
jgi:hypothetical protein